MTIGIIGAGTVGWTLATRWAEAGHDVMIAHRRDPSLLADRIAVDSGTMTAGTVEDAFARDVVLLAVPWLAAREGIAPEFAWDGRILIDATNIFLSFPPNALDDLGGDSGSEIIARQCPGARVVKAFNTLPIATMFAPLPADDVRRVLFLAGDDADASTAVAALVRDLDLHPVLLGVLATAGRQMELGGPLSGLELFTPGSESRH
jgi:predicted dinucleotide-binding enzyme